MLCLLSPYCEIALQPMLHATKPVAKIHNAKVQIASGLAGNLQAADVGGELPERLFTPEGLANRRFTTQAVLGNASLLN
jgi:hypothetical protein